MVQRASPPDWIELEPIVTEVQLVDELMIEIRAEVAERKGLELVQGVSMGRGGR